MCRIHVSGFQHIFVSGSPLNLETFEERRWKRQWTCRYVNEWTSDRTHVISHINTVHVWNYRSAVVTHSQIDLSTNSLSLCIFSLEMSLIANQRWIEKRKKKKKTWSYIQQSVRSVEGAHICRHCMCRCVCVGMCDVQMFSESICSAHAPHNTRTHVFVRVQHLDRKLCQQLPPQLSLRPFIGLYSACECIFPFFFFDWLNGFLFQFILHPLILAQLPRFVCLEILSRFRLLVSYLKNGLLTPLIHTYSSQVNARTVAQKYNKNALDNDVNDMREYKM